MEWVTIVVYLRVAVPTHLVRCVEQTMHLQIWIWGMKASARNILLVLGSLAIAALMPQATSMIVAILFLTLLLSVHQCSTSAQLYLGKKSKLLCTVDDTLVP